MTTVAFIGLGWRLLQSWEFLGKSRCFSRTP